MDRLEKNLARGPVKPARIVRNLPGRGKISVALKHFIEPYVEPDATLDQYRTLVNFAVIAWNCAILPEAERNAFIDEAARTFRDSDPAMEAEFRVHMAALIERKLAHFAEDGRCIVSFEATDLGDEFHLAVAAIIR